LGKRIGTSGFILDVIYEEYKIPLLQYFQTTNLHINLLFNGSLMDDTREGRPSFKTSDVVKNEVRDVIDGDRSLTVREVANKCITSKTTVHDILVQELHMNRIYAQWVPRMLSEENMTNRTEASKQMS
jgi:hypothetical protein